MAGPPGREMDFVVSAFGDDMERDLADQHADLDAFVMGGTTFRELSGYWHTPAAADEPLCQRACAGGLPSRRPHQLRRTQPRLSTYRVPDLTLLTECSAVSGRNNFIREFS